MLYYYCFQEKTVYKRCFYSAREMELAKYQCHKTHTVLSNADGMRHVYVDSLLLLGLDPPKHRSQSGEKYRELSARTSTTIPNLDNEA